MTMKTKELVELVQSSLSSLANPKDAPAMQAYMKTTMPFYGVKKPLQTPLYKEMNKLFIPTTQKEYEAGVRALWKLPHREEKYTALVFAGRHKEFIGAASLELYEELIRDGQWWDLVDEVAVHLVGRALLWHRKDVKGELYTWWKDDDLWMRRTSVIMHAHHKKDTDTQELFRVCKVLAEEKPFWIRKAIGWALREYAKVEPKLVKGFIKENRERLSGLSVREAEKGIARGNAR